MRRFAKFIVPAIIVTLIFVAGIFVVQSSKKDSQSRDFVAACFHAKQTEYQGYPVGTEEKCIVLDQEKIDRHVRAIQQGR